jgi:para-nitrobenzyl esterase
VRLALPRGRACRAINNTLPPIPTPFRARSRRWGPAIDNVVLLDTPLNTVRSGKFNKVPMILGSNHADGSIFVPVFAVIAPGTTIPPRESDLPAIIERSFNMFDAAVVRNLTTTLIVPAYPEAAYGNDTWAQATQMITHCIFTCSARRAARALVADGLSAWLYEFSYAIKWIENDLIPEIGTYHTSEISFVWGNEFPAGLHPWKPEDVQVRDAMMAWWTQFARDKNPNSANANTSKAPLVWPAFGKAAVDENLQIEIPFFVNGALDEYFCDNAWDPFVAALETAPRSQRFRK